MCRQIFYQSEFLMSLTTWSFSRIPAGSGCSIIQLSFGSVQTLLALGWSWVKMVACFNTEKVQSNLWHNVFIYIQLSSTSTKVLLLLKPQTEIWTSAFVHQHSPCSSASLHKCRASFTHKTFPTEHNPTSDYVCCHSIIGKNTKVVYNVDSSSHSWYTSAAGGHAEAALCPSVYCIIYVYCSSILKSFSFHAVMKALSTLSLNTLP